MSRLPDVHAQFDEKLKVYLYLQPMLVLFATIVGIPLIPLWIVLGPRWAKRYYDCLSCVATDRALVIRRGVWFRSHKTLALDKITDLAVIEGPLLNRFGLCKLQVETSGQSVAQGPDAGLVGIVDALTFRDEVLRRRDAWIGRGEEDAEPDGRGGEASALTGEIAGRGVAAGPALIEIRDALLRIEQRLARMAGDGQDRRKADGAVPTGGRRGRGRASAPPSA